MSDGGHHGEGEHHHEDIADVQACAVGRSSKTVREFLEKNYPEDLSRDDTIKLTIKSLLEVVQTGAKNIEISVMEKYGVVTVSLFSGPRNPLRLLSPRQEADILGTGTIRDRKDSRPDRIREGGRCGEEATACGPDPSGAGEHGDGLGVASFGGHGQRD
jgi:hypothetical protein